MNSNQSSIGTKIREYRKRAGMSQLDLEVAINASNGMISRIESDKVNPTKETLFSIAESLGLEQSEKADLFGIKNLFPSDKEIDSAREEVNEYFSSSPAVAYLID